jgi:hypothetical protein
MITNKSEYFCFSNYNTIVNLDITLPSLLAINPKLVLRGSSPNFNVNYSRFILNSKYWDIKIK